MCNGTIGTKQCGGLGTEMDKWRLVSSGTGGRVQSSTAGTPHVTRSTPDHQKRENGGREQLGLHLWGTDSNVTPLKE